MSKSKCPVPVTWTLLVLAGCSGESPDDVVTVSSALRYDNQSVVTPAYFGGTDASYNVLMAPGANPHGNAVAIVNAGCDHSGVKVNPGDPMSPCVIAGGPGSVKDTYIETKIAQLHAAGVMVFGYVWFGGNPPGSPVTYRSSSDLVMDLSNWYAYGSSAADRLDGIFFDGFTRATAGGLAQAEYVTDVVQSWFKFGEWSGNWSNWPGRAIFNWGNTPSQMQQYVECLIGRDAIASGHAWNYFVLHETYQTTFLGGVGSSPPSWLQNRFNPFHFMTMVHSATSDGSSVPLILWKSRNWNAGFTYVTDRTLASNPYAAPPAPAVWNSLLSVLNADCCYEYPNGTDYDEMPTSCPAADAATPSYP
jgi:hypothetical protein